MLKHVATTEIFMEIETEENYDRTFSTAFCHKTALSAHYLMRTAGDGLVSPGMLVHTGQQGTG